VVDLARARAALRALDELAMRHPALTTEDAPARLDNALETFAAAPPAQPDRGRP
jgi:hypothetical protein